ncbi:MAG: hypothetical protein BWY23_02374 [Spirochaetes bacterium ADurb.Bin218]|jgi:4-amino-4-deoxychorismate lyase|nr:aminotransferase class IV [Spirochaetota bacterium]OQA95549.1 MAG: hypothetical protein BWY23_02374 [Spirochaetes bacterium ADurb.Bin218]HOQ11853.1 aminotransferase class IV [Spirochaetota bacterium]HOV09550.1 aminotransferase class IV [Spirochaetota bacterium]
MSLFVESIKLSDGILFNLKYHQRRMDKTILECKGKKNIIDLAERINVPEQFCNGLYKVRVLYDDVIREVQFLPYTRRHPANLKLVEANIDYSFKYADRSSINKLLEENKTFDDIIITTNGLLRDSSSANIAFYDGEKWLTPTKPLLYGTKREYLLEEGKIVEEEISTRDIKFFYKVSLINAMLDLEEIAIPVLNIF